MFMTPKVLSSKGVLFFLGSTHEGHYTILEELLFLDARNTQAAPYVINDKWKELKARYES